MDYKNPKVASEFRVLLTNHEESLKVLFKDLKTRWRENSVKGETSDETHFNVGKQEGMIEALDELMKEITTVAHETHD